MKLNSLLIPAIAIAGIATANAQQTTPAVGYISLGDTDGDNAVAANTDIRFGVSFLNATEYSGAVAAGGVTATTIQVDGAAFAADAYAGYYCQVTSGSNDGQFLLVTANTADTLTVTAQPGDSTTGISDGDTIALSEAWTLMSLVGSRPVGTQVFTWDGSGDGINLATNTTYQVFDVGGGALSWVNTSSFAISDDVIVYPGEALILRTGASALPSFVLSGTVPTEANRNIIFGGDSGQDTPLSFTSPLDEQIAGLTFPSVIGDQLLIYDNASSGINKSNAVTYQLFDTGGQNEWVNTSTFAIVSDETIEAGSSFVFRRAAAADDTAATNTASYNTP
ncbi:MAG: TIGR02597 family protein [Luteolibacter sp.]